jgi:hypothetical protein
MQRTTSIVDRRTPAGRHAHHSEPRPIGEILKRRLVELRLRSLPHASRSQMESQR